MSIDKLSIALKKEAELQEKSILTKAKSEAAEILASAEKKVIAIETEINNVEAEIEAKNKYLQTSQQILADRRKKNQLENVYVLALKSQCKVLYKKFMTSKEYAGFLQNEFQKIKNELKKIEEIRADAISCKVFNTIKENNFHIYEDKAIEDGFIVKADEGKIKVLCNFESRFEKVWAKSAPEFVKAITKAVENGD